MKRAVITFIIIFSAGIVSAQGFKQALGIRAAWITPGIEYRYYINDVNSIKGLLSYRNRGLQIHALTEFHVYDLIPDVYQLQFFYGAGLHFGYESWDKSREKSVNHKRNYYTETSLLAGVDGLIGVEYIFYEAPLIAGVEIKPYIDLFGRYGLNIYTPDIAITLKYLF